LALTVCTRRSSISTRPAARTWRASSRIAAASVLTPSFCTFSVLILISPAAAGASSSPS
jgi:hypothetical protein